MSVPSAGLADVLALLGAVPFRADPATLTTVLEGAQAATLLGQSASTPLPVAGFWERLLPPEDVAGVLAVLRAVGEDGVPRVIEHGAQLPGRPPAVFRTAVQRRQEGTEAQLAGVMLEITSARASERQLVEVEAWLSAMVENLPFDFWICDRLGRFVLQNAASRRRFGNVVGETAATLPEAAVDAGAPRVESISRVLGGERVESQLTIRLRDEERVYARTLLPIQHGAPGEVSGVLGVDLEVTGLKRAEKRLRISLEELRAAQGELVRRERLAVLGEMAAAVAHEVRNPLGAMFNAIELLRRTHPGSEQAGQLIGILEEELRRLDVLVVNLFDLVRPLEPVLRRLPLSEVLEEALTDALRGATHAHRIRVRRRVSPTPLEVFMDAQLLGLALVNVLRNALQAMPEGGELGVDLEREEREAGQWARIVIRDSGPGISPEVRARMFEPFFTTRPTGSGLGLPIVRRVIAEHRGELEVHSERGQGTAFILRLPCVHAGFPPG